MGGRRSEIEDIVSTWSYVVPPRHVEVFPSNDWLDYVRHRTTYSMCDSLH
jgi:hypothetical protein